MSDLISRQDAITVCNSAIDLWERQLGVGALVAVRDKIAELPSAQPERKTGKWIYNSPVTMKCDQCGLVIKDWDWNRFKYCPNCDADMKGDIKNE